MFTIGNVQLWVLDQQQALEFWTERVGFEIRSDVTVPEMGNFRWLAVGPPNQPDVAITLMAIPGQPLMDDATADQVRDLVAKGYAGTIFLVTEDCRQAHRDLVARGVEFTEEPEERMYGIDAAFRDPSGNNVRLTQVAAVPA